MSIKDDSAPRKWYDSLPERWKQWIDKYVKENPDPARKAGLISSDFKGPVIINFEDSSHIVFHNSLCVYAENLDELAVFTEHCGYHIFSLGPEDWFCWWQREKCCVAAIPYRKPTEKH